MFLRKVRQDQRRYNLLKRNRSYSDLTDLNPVWEETCFILVSENDLKANEELLLVSPPHGVSRATFMADELLQMLWDEDKPSDDDLLGRIRVPLKELVQDAHQDRSDPLMKLTKDRASKGTLYWSSQYAAFLL